MYSTVSVNFQYIYCPDALSFWPGLIFLWVGKSPYWRWWFPPAQCFHVSLQLPLERMILLTLFPFSRLNSNHLYWAQRHLAHWLLLNHIVLPHRSIALRFLLIALSHSPSILSEAQWSVLYMALFFFFSLHSSSCLSAFRRLPLSLSLLVISPKGVLP